MKRNKPWPDPERKGEYKQLQRKAKIRPAQKADYSADRTYPALRRTKLLTTKYEPIPREVRQAVEARSKGRCEVNGPGCLLALQHLHHRLMRSQGGKHTAANLLATCMVCHGRVHASPEWSYRHGYLLHGVRTGLNEQP